MRAKVILNLALLAVAGVLAWAALRQGGEEQKEKPRLSALTAVQVSRIEIARKDQPEVRLSRQGGQWRMEAPYAVSADAARVTQLLEFVNTRSEGDFPVVASDLGKYELDPPRAALALNGERFLFGGSHPLNFNRYLRAGDTVHLTLDTTYRHLIADATVYVDPRPIEAGAQIAAIRVPGLGVEQREGKLTASAGEVAGDSIARFIEQWRQARALQVRALAENEAAATTERIEIELANRPALSLAILRREPDLVLARAELSLAYVFSGETARRLLQLEPSPLP